MKNKTILVERVALLKEGEKNGRKWQLCKVVDSEGNEYTTFNPNLYKEGEKKDVVFEEVERKVGDKVYMDKRLQDNTKKSGATSEALLVCRDILKKVENIEQKLEELLLLVSAKQ